MNSQYLLLWLEAPLQSWGNDSRFGRRGSLDFPTKSGVLGLICCARGAGGEEADWLADWADQDMQVIAYPRSDARGQPVMRIPLLRDFHMVGGGYDDQDPWEKLMTPKTADGKRPVGGGAKLTHRYYIQDMAYAVVLKAPALWASEADQALKAPCWDLYLGRKCCVPTEVIGQGLFASAEEAGERALELAEEKRRVASFRVREGRFDGEVFSLNDVPLSFGPHKRYRDRSVTMVHPEPAPS